MVVVAATICTFCHDQLLRIINSELGMKYLDKNYKEENVPFWSVMFAIFLGVFLGTFNMSAVKIALPIFIQSFNSSLDSVKWILTGFMLATGAACPLAGYLGEKLSFKKLYLFALIGFTLSSMFCAISFNIYMLVTFRVIQGIFSGLLYLQL